MTTTTIRARGRARNFAVVVLLLLLLLGVTPVARAEPEPTSPYPAGWTPPEARYGTSLERGRQVRMDDGALLTVDIVRPTDPVTGERLPGPFPVLLNQDMYAGRYTDVVDPPASYGDYFVERGYIYVHVHDRGTGSSEGHYDPGFGPRVGLDGVEMAYWVADSANLPGSNGRVGLHGCSALGVVQLSTLAALGRLLASPGSEVYVPGPTPDVPGRSVPVTADTHPIRASIPECVGTSVYHEQYTDNGVPSFIVALALAQPAAQAVLIGYNTDDPSSNYEQSIRSLDMIAGGDAGYYREHWRERDFIRRADEIARTGVPVLTWVGWQEGGPIGVLPLYAALQNAAAGRPVTAPMLPACPARGPATGCQVISPKYHTLIGDWAHGGGSDRGIELQWFETWVRDQDTGLERADQPIHVQELPSAASGRWVNATSYPMMPSYTPYFLDVGSALSPTPPASAGTASLVWPAGPAVTYTVAGAEDHDRTILGPPAVRLFVESSNTNVHLFLQLVDVAPDGTETPVTHGSILGSRRATDPGRSWSSGGGLPVLPSLTLDRDDYLDPGTPVQLDVPLQPTVWRLAAGHTVRLRIATNAGDKCSPAGALFAPPVGCFLTEPMARSLVGGVYTIHHGPGLASAVNLPLVPSDELVTVPSSPTPTSDEGTPLPGDWGSDARRPSR